MKRCHKLNATTGEQCLLPAEHPDECAFASEDMPEVKRIGASAVVRRRAYEPPKMTEHGSIEGVTLGTARPTVGICK